MMKYRMIIPEMLFHKIRNEGRRLDVHLFDKACQQIKIHDQIEYEADHSHQVVLREVKGIGLFENFADLASSIPPEMFGYTNSDEILVRLNRLYSKEKQEEFNVLLLFLDEAAPVLENLARDELER